MSILARSHGLPIGLLAMAVFVVPLCGQAPGSLTPDYSTHLRGTVINSVTGAPVSHALVYSPDNRFATMTNDEGRFDFTLPQVQSDTVFTPGGSSGPPSESTGRLPAPNRPSGLLARKPGFIDDPEGQVLIQPQQEEVTLPLIPEARVLGRVVLNIPESPDRVRVSLYRRVNQDGRVRWELSNGYRMTRADSSFRFTNLVPGTYKLFTNELPDRDPLTFDLRGPLFGYPPVYYPAAADFDSAAEIHLVPGQTTEATLTPPRREYYRVRIPVRSGPSLSQVDVQIWPQNHPGPGFSLGYDPGNAELEGTLPNGAYTIIVRSFEPNPMTGMANVVVSGAPLNAPPVSLVPNVSIPITVRDEMQNHPEISMTQGTPSGEQFVVNPRRPSYLNPMLIPVDAFDSADQVGLSPASGPDDISLHFDNVSPGRYRVRVLSSGGYASSVISGNADLLHGILVVPPGSASPIEITVRDDGAQVHGQVEGLSESHPQPVDQPFPRHVFPGDGFYRQTSYWGEHRPIVYFIPEPRGSGGQFIMSFVTPDGQFDRPQVPPGSYRVVALDHQQGDLEFAGEEQLSRYDSCAQRIAFAAGDKQTLRLSLCATED